MTTQEAIKRCMEQGLIEVRPPSPLSVQAMKKRNQRLSRQQPAKMATGGAEPPLVGGGGKTSRNRYYIPPLIASYNAKAQGRA